MPKPKKKSKPAKKHGHGGARSGAGKPRDKLPKVVIDRLGPPPKTANELRTWNAKLLAEVQWLSVQGLIGTELAATLRANAGSIDRALPVDPRPSDQDDEDDLEDDGPALTKGVPGGGELRIG